MQTLTTKRFTPFLLLVGVATTAYPAPPTPAQIDTARAGGLAWLVSRQAGDGSWTTKGSSDVIATSATLDGFLNAGIKTASSYSRGLSWLANARVGSTDALARQAMTLSQGGIDSFVAMKPLVLNQDLNKRSWGAYKYYDASFPDTCLAVDALKVTGYVPGAGNGTINIATSLTFIASKQNSDFGWPYWPHNFAAGVIVAPASKMVPTTHCVMTLSKNKATLLAADLPRIANGIAWIKARQKGDGGFGDGGSSTLHETVPAYLTITTELGAGDASAGEALSYIVNAQRPDGSWNGDPFLTGLALRTMPTLAIGALADGDGDGIPNVVETAMSNIGLGGVTADGRPTTSNGNTTASRNNNNNPGAPPVDLIPSVPFNVSIGNVQLAVSGGTAPYTWTIISGGLPPGLTLSSTGILSGTATTTGTFVFTYQVTDASGYVMKRELGNITIFDPAWVVNIINTLLLDD